MKKRILVTGATGFIGRHLIPELMALDFDVWAMIRYVTGRTFQHDVKTVYADIRDPLAVRQAIKLIQPEYLIHLAAISPVAYSYDKYIEVTETNYQGTVILAEACLRFAPHFKQFIFAGTSEEYGNQLDFPINENARCHPNSPYAVAKHASTKYLEYMRDAYQFPMTVLRPFNTYGRTENLHFVTERIISQMLQNHQVRLGDPTPIRDLMYLDDHVAGYTRAIGNKKAIGQVINLCTGRGTSIKELVDKITELTDYKGEVEWHTIPSRPLDIHQLIGDKKKANMLLAWVPQYPLEKGLKKTIQELNLQIFSEIHTKA